MNAIEKAISELHFTIPKQILQAAFVSRYDSIWKVSATGAASLDAQILNNVVRPRVLVDCNLIGGTQVMLPLNGLSLRSHDGVSSIVHIPKTVSHNRSITSVLHIAFLQSPFLAQGSTGSMGIYQSQSVSASTGVASAVIASYDTIPIISTARVELIAENTVLIKDLMALQANSVLRCVLANDVNMENLQQRSYRAFAKLVGYAVKAYIYNTMVVTLDETALMNGMQLGSIKAEIEKYTDAETNYQDYLRDDWEVTSLYNDTTTKDRILRLLVGGNR